MKKGEALSLPQVVNKTSVSPRNSKFLHLCAKGPRPWATQCAQRTLFCVPSSNHCPCLESHDQGGVAST